MLDLGFETVYMGLARWVVRIQKRLNKNGLLEILCNAIPSSTTEVQCAASWICEPSSPDSGGCQH